MRIFPCFSKKINGLMLQNMEFSGTNFRCICWIQHLTEKETKKNPSTLSSRTLFLHAFISQIFTPLYKCCIEKRFNQIYRKIEVRKIKEDWIKHIISTALRKNEYRVVKPKKKRTKSAKKFRSSKLSKTNLENVSRCG